MSKLRIVITSEHREDDRRFMDSELRKFCAVLERAGFRNEAKVTFESIVPPDPGPVATRRRRSTTVPASEDDSDAGAAVDLRETPVKELAAALAKIDDINLILGVSEADDRATAHRHYAKRLYELETA